MCLSFLITCLLAWVCFIVKDRQRVLPFNKRLQCQESFVVESNSVKDLNVTSKNTVWSGFKSVCECVCISVYERESVYLREGDRCKWVTFTIPPLSKVSFLKTLSYSYMWPFWLWVMLTLNSSPLFWGFWETQSLTKKKKTYTGASSRSHPKL